MIHKPSGVGMLFQGMLRGKVCRTAPGPWSHSLQRGKTRETFSLHLRLWSSPAYVMGKLNLMNQSSKPGHRRERESVWVPSQPRKQFPDWSDLHACCCCPAFGTPSVRPSPSKQTSSEASWISKEKRPPSTLERRHPTTLKWVDGC